MPICPTENDLDKIEELRESLRLEVYAKQAAADWQTGKLRFNLEDLEKLIGNYYPDFSNLSDYRQPSEWVKTLRSAKEYISNYIGRKTTSPYTLERNFFKFLHGFYGDLTKPTSAVMARNKIDGGDSYGKLLAHMAGDYLHKILDPDPEVRRVQKQRIHSALDPMYSKLHVRYKNLNTVERKAYKFIKTAGLIINDINYSLGYIPESRWLHSRRYGYISRKQDYYLPEGEIGYYNRNINDILAGKPERTTRMFMGMYIKRKPISEEMLEHAVEDPVVLITERIQQTVRNKALNDAFKHYALNPDLVTDTDTPGFVKMPDDPGYGILSGKYLRKDIAEDLRGVFFTNQHVQTLYKILNAYGTLPPRLFLKKYLTVFNPSVRIGNRTNSFFIAGLNGINPVSFYKRYKEAYEEIGKFGKLGKGGKDYSYLMKNGIIGINFDRTHFATWLDEVQNATDNPSFLEELKKVGKKLDKTLQDTYSTMDDAAKLAAFKYWRYNKNFSPEEALRRVQDGWTNYRNVGYWYHIGSQMPIFGNAFVKFQGDITRIITNTTLQNPFPGLIMLMTFGLLQDAMSHLSNETEADRKARETRPGSPHIPFLGTPLTIQTPWGELNASRLIGLYNITPLGSYHRINDLSRVLPIQMPEKKTFGTDPLIGPLLSLAIDTDFRGKSILDPEENRYIGSTLTPTEKAKNAARHLILSYLTPVKKDTLNVIKAIQGKEDIYGREKTVPQSLASLGGLKIQEFGPAQAQEAREKARLAGEAKIEFIKTKIQAIHNSFERGEITEEQALNRIGHLRDQLYEDDRFEGSARFYDKYSEALISKSLGLEEGKEFRRLNEARKKLVSINRRIDNLVKARNESISESEKERLSRIINGLFDEMDRIMDRALK